MDVLLLHDVAAPPFDAWDALTREGHRVAAHGLHVEGIAVFLDAMTWTPEALVVDARTDAKGARDVVQWLAGHPAVRSAPRVVLAGEDAAFAGASAVVTDAEAALRVLRSGNP